MAAQLPDIKALLQATQQLVRLLYVQITLFFLFFWIIDLVLFVPLATLLLDRFIQYSGNRAIGNFDIAAFLLTPAGLAFGAVSLVIFIVVFMLKIAGLLLVTHGGVSGQKNTPVDIFRQLARKTATITGLAMRSVVLLTAVTVPLALPVVLLQKKLLAAHDINYYLSVQPPEYRLAIAALAVLAITASLFYSGIIISLVFALPQVLFADQSAAQALRDSTRRFKTIRGSIILTFVKCLLLWFVPALLVNLTVYLVGWVLIKLSGSSMILLLPAAGVTLGLNLITGSVLGFIALSVISFLVYLIWHRVEHREPMRVEEQAAPPLPQGKILFAGVLMTIAAAIVTGGLMLNTLDIEDHVVIIAHRGSAASTPENTLSAVRKSAADGADMAEIDVQLTGDGVVVLWHDNDAMRISGKPLVISATDLNTLKTLDAGSWFSPEFGDERIATLDEAIKAAKAGNIGLLVELKSYAGDKEQLVDAVVALLQQHDFSEQAPIMSLKHEEVKILRQRYPELEAGFVVSASLGDLTKLDENFLILSRNLATDSMVSALHAQSKKVFVWTIDDTRTMSMLINQGVDGIITNTPDKMAALLRERVELSPAELLLLRFGELYRW
ncbi:MAG: hypothetical protein GQ559_11335 [Desulfobulbaceae bacterium]|nr:hypothetical protein [Desulfobulbaceae bacterium]